MLAHDVILYNGKVITLDRGSHIVEAVAFRGGRISAVGRSSEVLEGRSPDTEAVDLQGKVVTPGFFDAHPHLDREGLKSRGGTRIQGLDSIDGILAVVRNLAEHTPPGEWIVLMPLEGHPNAYYDVFVNNAAQLRDGRFPTRYDLDQAAPEHPVYIRAAWGWWCRPPFASVANSLALETAGVTQTTPSPHNVEIVKDQDGKPTGVFLEHNHCPILEYTLFQCVPRFTYEDRVAAVRTGARLYSAVGTTTCYEGHGLTPTIISAYRQAEAEGQLTLRMYAPLSVPSASINNTQFVDLLRTWGGRFGGSDDGLFHCDGITLDMGDPRVANIVGKDYPYEQWAGHFYQSVPFERFVELGVSAAEHGVRVNCLACYDLERLICAYEEINRRIPIRDRRWVMVHLMSGSDAQLGRIRDLGIIATVIPNIMYWFSERFGLDSLGNRGVPIRGCLDRGVPVVLSTDNVPYSMLFTMWEALARWDNVAERCLGESNLSREEALRAAVQTGHLLTFGENDQGSIEVGKLGDVVVLADDPLTCELDRIKDIKVSRTYVGGREVFRRN